MSFASDGKLYAIDFDGKLFTVDVNTGAKTLIGDTGVVSEQITGGFIDPEDDTFYWSVKSESQAAFYKVNIADATATLLYNFENQEQLGGIGSKQLPVAGQQSFFVVNDQYQAFFKSDGSYSSAFKAYSGNQYLCSMYAMKGETSVTSDDWAISPELYGGAQTVKLFATSFLADAGQEQYYETFEVLYSTDGKDPEDFKLLARFEDIPAAWVEYSVYLPEGAKYFAIRSVSYDQYMLFVDDIRFSPKNGKAAESTLTGYNIYRDGVKLSADAIDGTSFTDGDVTTGSTHRYVVTALYDEGKSNPSNEVEVSCTSGIGNVDATNVNITAATGEIIVEGAVGTQITVVAADGRLAAAVTGAQRTIIHATPGIYVVIVGDKAAKLAVK